MKPPVHRGAQGKLDREQGNFLPCAPGTFENSTTNINLYHCYELFGAMHGPGGSLPIGEAETARREFLLMDDIRCAYACGF